MKTSLSWHLVILVVFVLVDKLIKHLLISYTNLAFINRNFGLNIQIFDWLAIVLIFLLIAAMIIMYIKTRSMIIVLLFSGSIANITDRIIWGGVVDYIKVPNLFIFNLADMLIIISISIIFLSYCGVKFKWQKSSNLMK